MLQYVYLQVYLWAALCSVAPAVQTCQDPGQCFAHVKRTALLLLHLRQEFETVLLKHCLDQLTKASCSPAMKLYYCANKHVLNLWSNICCLMLTIKVCVCTCVALPLLWLLCMVNMLMVMICSMCVLPSREGPCCSSVLNSCRTRLATPGKDSMLYS